MTTSFFTSHIILMLLGLISMWFASVLILFLYYMIHDRVARSVPRKHHFSPYVCQRYYILGKKPIVNSRSTRTAILFMVHPMFSIDDEESILLVLFLKCICSPNRQAEECENQLLQAIFFPGSICSNRSVQ